MQAHTDSVPRFYTVAEAAEKLGISKDTVYQKVRDLEWPHTSITRTIRFTDDDLREIVQLAKVRPIKRGPKQRPAKAS